MAWRSSIKPIAKAICNLDFPEHFAEWERLSEDEKRLLVIASRDSGKSTFFTKLLPLFRCMTRPKYEICIISYSDKQVMKLVEKISELIDSCPPLRPLRPKNSATSWSKTTLVFPIKSRIDALSFGASGRGGHYDLIIVDDPVKDFAGMDPEDQERYFKNAVTPMVKPDGQLVMVGTFVYEGDLIEKTESNKAYKTKLYPAISSGRALWPERWPLDKLDDRRREIGDFAFSREYLLEKIDPKTQFFRRETIRYYDTAPEYLSMVLTVDPAITLDGDATAMMLTGVSSENKVYLLDYANMRSENVRDIVDKIFQMMQPWQCKALVIEAIGFQRLFKHWIYDEMRKRNYFFGIEEVKSHGKSKQARIMSLQPMVTSGTLLFGKNHSEVVDQLMIFPRGKHDDMIDSLSLGLEFWQKPSVPVQKTPENSFNWWASKLAPASRNYQEAMFSDLKPISRPGNLHLLQ